MDYIEIPNWDGTDDSSAGFQHYKDRDPKWIKNYTRLLAKDEYLQLTLRQRGLLHGVWLAYASSGRKLGASPAQLRRALGSETVRARDIEALNHAGLIVIRASASLAERSGIACLEERREEQTVRSNVVEDVAALDLEDLSAPDNVRVLRPLADVPEMDRDTSRVAAEINGRPNRDVVGGVFEDLLKLRKAQPP